MLYVFWWWWWWLLVIYDPFFLYVIYKRYVWRVVVLFDGADAIESRLDGYVEDICL